MLAGLAPVRASAGAAGGWGPVRPSQSSGHPGPVCLRRFLSAVLRIIVPAPAPSSPSFVGACGGAQSAPALLRRLFPLADCTSLALWVDRASVGHSYASFASRQKTTVSLYVVGLGLAGSVGAGRSAWRVTRKTNCPWRCVSPDLSALGGAVGVDLSHVVGLIRSLPNL
jgi:hypothetical protein